MKIISRKFTSTTNRSSGVKSVQRPDPGPLVSNKVKDYGNDPFFVKKAKESKTFLEKHGFPKELLTLSSMKGSKDKGVRTLKN